MARTAAALDRSTASWVADARAVFAARILAAIDQGPDVGAEVLLGCLPAGQARHLVRTLQAGPEARDDPPDLAGAADRLADPGRLASVPVGRLLAAFGLPTGLGPHLALLTLVEHDAAMAPLLGYLNDDARRRHLTVGLAERLAGPLPRQTHDLLAPGAPLRASALLELEEGDGRPLPDRHLRWVDHIAAWLLSDRDVPDVDPALRGHVVPQPTVALDALVDAADVPGLASAASTPVVVLVGAVGSGRALLAQAMAANAARGALVVSGARIGASAASEHLLRLAVRDATLRNEHLVVCDAGRVPEAALAAALHRARCPIVLTAGERLGLDVAHVAVPAMDGDRARRLWRAALGPKRQAAGDQLAHRFRLPASDIVRIAGSCGDRADLDALSAACVERSARTLDDLAARVETRFDWADLVLPPRQLDQLRSLEARVRHGHEVFDTWGFGEKLAPDEGLVALFSGPSGAGKTLSGGILARSLGLPLYRVDLSATVSKYIGETEKNLEAIFGAAEAGNACLLFDECDALFAKRTEVGDAHDRYANLETSYLLQRLERHRGIVLLSSNHPQNIDEAFTRRIDVTVEFPMPDAPGRTELWRRLLPDRAGAAIDAAHLGATFELSGGSIRSCLLGAAFLAASNNERIDTAHCVRAVAEEYQKLGKALTRADFGELFREVRTRRPG